MAGADPDRAAAPCKLTHRTSPANQDVLDVLTNFPSQRQDADLRGLDEEPRQGARPVKPVAGEALATLFGEARTFTRWQDRPVPDGVVERALGLAQLGPTSANCQPMRLALVRSAMAKERLLPCVSSGNYEKVRTAPVTAIVAYDREFYDYLPRLYPHTDARGWFTTDEALALETAFRNGSLQGAYLILALRAQGLDCGPMSGFDPAKVDAAFFPEGRYRSNFLLNIGYGERAGLRPRLPRLGFAEVGRWE
jgi:3-hydroxypropanoate dehydrogenase